MRSVECLPSSKPKISLESNRSSITRVFPVSQKIAQALGLLRDPLATITFRQKLPIGPIIQFIFQIVNNYNNFSLRLFFLCFCQSIWNA